MIVCGGHHAAWPYRDIRVFDTETNCWLSIPAAKIFQKPEGLYNHSAFAYRGELYVFGGENHRGQSLNDLWKLNPQTFTWKKIEPKGKDPYSEMYYKYVAWWEIVS